MLNLLLTMSLQSLIGSSMIDRRTFGRLIVCGTFYSKFLTVVHYTTIFFFERLRLTVVRLITVNYWYGYVWPPVRLTATFF
jgi:hypothetical protein